MQRERETPERVDCSARLPANDLATRDRETRRQEAASAHAAIASRARRVAVRDPMSDSLPLASSIVRHYDNSRRARSLAINAFLYMPEFISRVNVATEIFIDIYGKGAASSDTAIQWYTPRVCFAGLVLRRGTFYYR